MRYTKGLQVVLLKPNRSEAYAEVEHDSHKYAIGEPGQPFEVQITIPQKVFISADKIFVDLHVEGQSPGYSYTLDKGHDSCTYKGFKSVLNGEQRYRQFEFAKPCKTAGHAIESSAPEAGQLRVKFTH